MQSKFDENDLLFLDFLRNSKFSIQNKSFHVFKRLGIKDWVVRQEIENGNFKPWRDPERFGQWAFKPEYGVTDKLTLEESKMEWLKLMDHWYRECFENEYVKVRSCHFVHGVLDVGLFCRREVALSQLGYRVPGYLEPIDAATFITLKSIGHPSLYEYSSLLSYTTHTR